MVDPYGSHLMRLILDILAGSSISSQLSESIHRSKSSKKYNELVNLNCNEEWYD